MSIRHRNITYVLALAGCCLLLQGLFISAASAEEVSGTMNAGASASTTRPMPKRPMPQKPEVPPRPAPVKDQLKERMENIRDAQQQAQGERPGPRPVASSTLRMRVEAKLDERKEVLGQKLEAARMKVLSKFGAEALNQFKKVDDRLSEALKRLAEISSRIDSRIEKLRSENVDVATIESLNATAKQKLTDAQTKVSAITVPTLPTNASTTKEQINASLKGAREQVKAAEVAIQAARDAFMKVVAEMKTKGGAKAEVEAGATTETAPAN